MGRENASKCSIVKSLINKFLETCAVANKNKPIRRQAGRSIRNIAAVVLLQIQKPQRHRSQKFRLVQAYFEKRSLSLSP